MNPAVADAASTPALTIRQPYAGLVMAGIKDVENRSWQCAYRGPLAIHAGLQRATFPEDVSVARFTRFNGVRERLDEVYGAMLGWVTLVDIVTGHDSRWAIEDMYHWVLAEPVLLDDARPMRGRQGLWTYHAAP
ncbi:ASCH domain-containing protein [Streptomyces sp. NPDC057302]|uniref:ASCH domain-containing protein n=1 Tax=Streptomyces sp. NPDC057302 TaxID=3346094 RepID=UPI003644E041